MTAGSQAAGEAGGGKGEKPLVPRHSALIIPRGVGGESGPRVMWPSSQGAASRRHRSLVPAEGGSKELTKYIWYRAGHQ
jgi:hypothetical protein